MVEWVWKRVLKCLDWFVIVGVFVVVDGGYDNVMVVIIRDGGKIIYWEWMLVFGFMW